MRRHNFIIFILCSIPLCWANNEFLCQKFDNDTFEYFCTDYTKLSRVATIKNCLPHRFSVEPTQVLDFKIGGCDNITVRDELDRYKNVRDLDISYSGLKSMYSIHFSHHRVEKVNMSHNQIIENRWHLLLDFCARFPNLIELDLSYNDLHAIHLFANRSIIKLKQLHLQHNAIAHIQKGAFTNLTELELIDLSYNRLNLIHANAFSNLQQLNKLHIEHNPIEFFFCEDLLNRRRIHVYISWNHVEYLNTDCFGIGNNFAPPTHLVAAHHSPPGLYGNAVERFYRIDCGYFQSFYQIRTFKAGRNKYRDVLKILECFGTELLELNLSGNFIQQLDDTTFQRFSKLQELSLRGTGLKSFDFQALQQQRDLISLDISQNGLESLENILLSRNLRELQNFLVAGNLLKAGIKWEFPETIKILDVSDTVVGVLGSKFFQQMNALEELYLRNTSLSFINGNPFERLENLTVLDISQNNLDDWDFKSFAPIFENLREFRAANCNIVNAIDLIDLFGENLCTLDLSGNFIGDLDKESPLHRLNLMKLFLNRANISIFDLNTLSESSNLEYFEIAGNTLQEIDLTPLSANLMDLNLSGNKLSVIIDLTPTHFAKLRYLNIGQNRLSCEYLTDFANDFAGKNAHFEEWDRFEEFCLVSNGIDVPNRRSN